MRVLFTGADGQLGRCLTDRLPGDWVIKKTDVQTLDITDSAAVQQIVNTFRPDVIVNTAAYTAVDHAETEVDIAERINALGPKNLAKAALNHQAKFIHISTDYVFDGDSSQPYKESDLTNPLGIYGLSKRKGEQFVCAINQSAIIIRTAWVFSEYGNNFVKSMLKLGLERESLGIVDDQRGCPTYAGDLANIIILMIQNSDVKGGIYHYCGNKDVSWFGFAKSIFERAKEAGYKSSPQLYPIKTLDYPTAAKRPAYSVLNCEKIKATLNIEESNWQIALSTICKKLI